MRHRCWFACLAVPFGVYAAPPSDILVEGHRVPPQKQVKAAVQALAPPVAHGGFEFQYGRWEDPVCVAVAGLSRDGGEFVADRVGVIARSVGLSAGGAGCVPNIIVVVTDDPDRLIGGAVNKLPQLLAGIAPAELTRLQQSHAPVRWASATAVTSSQGDPATDVDVGTGHRQVRQLAQWRSSHVAAPTRTQLTQVSIVVDSRKLSGISYAALAAYVGMVALTDPRPDNGVNGLSTIMALFPARTGGPSNLTAFDRAYLSARYKVDPMMPGDTQRLQMIGLVNDALLHDRGG